MFDVHQSVFDENGELDDGLAEDYDDGIAEAFAESAEGTAAEQELGRLGWCSSFIHYGLTYLGQTPPEMSLRDVNEILFEIIPRKVTTEADQAESIIREIRAFWQFLGRQYELPNAAAIIDSLDDEAERELHEALSDSGNFGMAKSMMMMGMEAGFDMTTQEGLNEFMLAYNQNLLNSSAAAATNPAPPTVETPMQGSNRIEKSPTGRVGRNEPCPCGSGKKYKKCCARKG